MARTNKSNATANNGRTYDTTAIQNSVVETNKDNYDVREFTLSPTLKLQHYMFDNFETVTLLVDSIFCIKCIVRTDKDGKKFCSFPSYKDKNGKYQNTAYTFDKATIEAINYCLY